jgi:hypothetical protein
LCLMCVSVCVCMYVCVSVWCAIADEQYFLSVIERDKE